MIIRLFLVILAAYRKMSDTDSIVLTKPLPEELVGKELGQMKLEYEIKKAIFIRKKLYYILTPDDQVIIKASGIDSGKLNYDLFLDLLNGESVQIEKINFKVGWKDLTINVEKSNITVRGLTDKFKTLEDLNANINLNKNESDFYLLFSKSEIILFFISLFILLIFIYFYINL